MSPPGLFIEVGTCYLFAQNHFALEGENQILFDCDMDPVSASTTALSVIGTTIKMGWETYISVQGARMALAHIQRVVTKMQGL